MQAISKGLEKVIQELSASENDGPVSENFIKVFKELVSFSRHRQDLSMSAYLFPVIVFLLGPPGGCGGVNLQEVGEVSNLLLV